MTCVVPTVALLLKLDYWCTGLPHDFNVRYFLLSTTIDMELEVTVPSQGSWGVGKWQRLWERHDGRINEPMKEEKNRTHLTHSVQCLLRLVRSLCLAASTFFASMVVSSSQQTTNNNTDFDCGLLFLCEFQSWEQWPRGPHTTTQVCTLRSQCCGASSQCKLHWWILLRIGPKWMI